MKFYMKGQEKGGLLIEVTAGLTIWLMRLLFT